MQTAHTSALFATAFAPALPVHAQFKFNQSRQDASIRVLPQHELCASGGDRGGWWMTLSRTGAAGRIHCEGSTK